MKNLKKYREGDRLRIEDVINSRVQSLTPIYFIAEVGINHNGNMNIAKSLIDEAKKSDCDAVKFQKRTIEKVYTKALLDEPRESPWGSTQRDQKLGLEFSTDQFIELREYSREKSIDFAASAWDLDSLTFIESLNPDFHKVASAFITNCEFLVAVAKLGRPTIVSTGMCRESDIALAVEIFQDNKCPFMLLHTVSEYPCKESELNLLYIQTLGKKFNINVGYSGHESSVSPSYCAAALGAKVIERHITLDRSMYGSDQSASLEIEGLRRLVAGLRKYPGILGSGEKTYSEKEKLIAKKLRYWESD